MAKIFLRSLWAENMDWDKKFDSNKLSQWTEIFQHLHAISGYPIPRFLGHSPDSGATFQLLCFCDASAESYATTVYLRSSLNNTHRINLVFSKTRLSPADKLSIPRLELMAAQIGVRSLNFVQTQLRLPVEAKVLWSDSQVVLHWIRGKGKKQLSVFVENRVKDIRKTTDITYRYVKTTSNPADMATRGRSVDELKNSIWWHGPPWLKQDVTSWPNWDVEVTDQATLDYIDEETRKSAKVMFEVGLVVGEGPSDEEMVTPIGIDRKKYSSFFKLLRVTATCLRFLDKVDKRKSSNHNTSAFTAQEIAKAKLLWELAVQRHYYADVFDAIKNGSKNSFRDQLGLQIDDSGLLRCCGRFENANLSEAARMPKLLPSKDYFTRLVIESFHKTALHSGISQTLASIRHEYWIPQGRSRVRQVLTDCLICRHVIGGPYKLPVMAPWPKERMSQSAAFSYTGLDYFGPLYVRDGTAGPTRKVWVCLFTCLAVRAIHLELVEDMSTEQFLMCLRRFVSRHGKPTQFISDNATQFKLAKTTIDKAWSTVLLDPETQNYLATQGIEWKFIIEFAPWTGGFYERMVGLVKSVLKKSIGKLCLNMCQLITLLSEVQAVVNSRPLVYVGDDLNSDISLTPAHFLGLNPHIGVPEFINSDDETDPEYVTPNSMSSAEKLLLIWKKGQRHLNRFWKIWQDNYLLSLRERTQHHVAHGRIQSQNTPKSGDVVLIKDNLPRGSWKLGKIQKLISSLDGQTRSAIILLPSKKTVNCPVSLLYPIECPAVPILGDGVVDDPPTVVQHGGGVDQNPDSQVQNVRPPRTAAIRARENIRNCIRGMVGLQLVISDTHSTESS